VRSGRRLDGCRGGGRGSDDHGGGRGGRRCRCGGRLFPVAAAAAAAGACRRRRRRTAAWREPQRRRGACGGAPARGWGWSRGACAPPPPWGEALLPLRRRGWPGGRPPVAATAPSRAVGGVESGGRGIRPGGTAPPPPPPPGGSVNGDAPTGDGGATNPCAAASCPVRPYRHGRAGGRGEGWGGRVCGRRRSRRPTRMRVGPVSRCADAKRRVGDDAIKTETKKGEGRRASRSTKTRAAGGAA